MDQLKKKNLLLVDDEIIISMATQKRLEAYGYKVLLASNCEQVLETLARRDDIILVLMDIDLGGEINGIDLSRLILEKRNIPIVFVSSHTEPEIISLTEGVTSYGYIVKSSSITAYDASIKMAYKLFIEKKRTEVFDKYLKAALENASEPIFISDTTGRVIYCNKAYLQLTGMGNSENYVREISEYIDFIKVFSDRGQPLPPDDWASTRGLKGLSGTNEIFYVFNTRLKALQVNQYTYAPILDEFSNIIGSYVKVGMPLRDYDPLVIEAIQLAIDSIVA